MGETRILLVEDEQDIREILCLALEGEGYAVDAVSTVADAKSRLATIHYALVMTDRRLSDGDGMEIADWAKEMGSKPWFERSSYPRCRVGAFEHETLMKPFRPSELVRIVQQNIGEPGG